VSKPGEEIFSGTGVQVTGEFRTSPYGVEDELIEVLSEAKYSVDLWMYQLTSKEIRTVLKNLALLGVDVDLVMENATYGGSTKEYDSLVKYLSSSSVDIGTDEELGTNFMHAKTLLIDTHAYVISTANF
jgi:phosphatidylserine/phosphatidylglycerophosphate/cardiolipin synthase-like enzyme